MDTTPEIAISPASSQTRPQSPAGSSECTEVLEDGFDDHDEVASLRAEAVLRRRASSFDADHVQNMPGVVLFTGTSR